MFALLQLNRAEHTYLLNIQDFLNRVEHIRVDYALITQALEHAALLLQMPQTQLFSQGRPLQ